MSDVHLASGAKIIETGVLLCYTADVIRNVLHSAHSCIRRVRVSNTGNVFSPACSAATEPVDSPSPIDIPNLPEEDSNEVCFSLIY